MSELLHKNTTDCILQAAIKVHKALEPGLLESGRHLECGYRIDLLVDKAVIVEIKSIEKIAPIHKAQLLTYMRLAELKVGLLLNFNVKLLRDGIVRQVLSSPNNLSALSASSAVNS